MSYHCPTFGRIAFVNCELLCLAICLLIGKQVTWWLQIREEDDKHARQSSDFFIHQLRDHFAERFFMKAEMRRKEEAESNEIFGPILLYL